jgi:hypothetical protein
MVKKQFEEVECVAVKITKLGILCYDSICSMCHYRWHILPLLPLSYSEKNIGKPKEEIRNLNRFEYMYLSDLKVPYF